MPRIPIQASTANQGNVQRLFHSSQKANLKLQIFDPVTVYLSQNQADLVSLDPVGNPKRGLQLTAGVYDFLGFNGELWVSCNQQIEVELAWWLL